MTMTPIDNETNRRKSETILDNLAEMCRSYMSSTRDPLGPGRIFARSGAALGLRESGDFHTHVLPDGRKIGLDADRSESYFIVDTARRVAGGPLTKTAVLRYAGRADACMRLTDAELTILDRKFNSFGPSPAADRAEIELAERIRELCLRADPAADPATFDPGKV